MDPSLKTLAEGCFGKVYKQRYRDKWAAMKKVPVGLIDVEELKREFRVYEKAQHNNIVKLLGVPYLEDGKWHIPLEFIFGEDLETTIFKVQKSKIQLTQSVKGKIITGMCEGLNFLHSKDIVHQDLKPDNVMIEERTHRAVIIDMGLAKFFRNGLSSAKNMGNEAYSAPEVWHGSVRDKCSDVWAMGKIIAELCQRVRFPTHSVNSTKMKESLKGNPYCNVVCQMVKTNAAQRSSMAGVIGEIRQIQAEAERPNMGLGVQMGACGQGAVDLGARRQLPLLSPFLPEVKPSEARVVHAQNNPLLRPEPQGPAFGNPFGNMFPAMPFPHPSPGDGRVVNHEFKQVITRNGKVVRYENVKFTK